MIPIEAELPDRRSLARQWRKVYGPLDQIPFRIVCLSEALVKRFLHYDPSIKRNVPCCGEDVCDWCRKHHARRFMAYVAAVRCDTHEICVAEVTEHAVRCMLALKLLPGNLRGWVFTLQRELKKKNAPVHVLKPVRHRTPANLPAAFDPIPHLARLWGWCQENAEQLAARNRELNELHALIDQGGPAAGEIPS